MLVMGYLARVTCDEFGCENHRRMGATISGYTPAEFEARMLQYFADRGWEPWPGVPGAYRCPACVKDRQIPVDTPPPAV